MTDHAYAVFLDILGYRDLLKRDVDSGERTFHARVTRAVRVFEEVNGNKFQFECISDSIFIYCGDRTAVDALLEITAKLFRAFLHEGLLLRGGISFGEHFRNLMTTYSPALTKAYQLESTLAEFPRVMVDENIVDMFPSVVESGRVLPSCHRAFFLNVAGDDLPTLWKDFENAVGTNERPIRESERVRSKYKWLQDHLRDLHDLVGLPPPAGLLKTFSDKAALFTGTGDAEPASVALSVTSLVTIADVDGIGDGQQRA